MHWTLGTAQLESAMPLRIKRHKNESSDNRVNCYRQEYCKRWSEYCIRKCIKKTSTYLHPYSKRNTHVKSGENLKKGWWSLKQWAKNETEKGWRKHFRLENAKLHKLTGCDSDYDGAQLWISFSVPQPIHTRAHTHTEHIVCHCFRWTNVFSICGNPVTPQRLSLRTTPQRLGFIYSRRTMKRAKLKMDLLSSKIWIITNISKLKLIISKQCSKFSSLCDQ